MELLLENLLSVSIFVVIAGIAFAAFIASPYEIQFEDTEDVEEF
jgi:hypothetical protein